MICGLNIFFYTKVKNTSTRKCLTLLITNTFKHLPKYLGKKLFGGDLVGSKISIEKLNISLKKKHKI